MELKGETCNPSLKSDLESTLIQVKYRFYADRPFFAHLEKMQEFISDGILLPGGEVPYLSLYF